MGSSAIWVSWTPDSTQLVKWTYYIYSSASIFIVPSCIMHVSNSKYEDINEILYRPSIVPGGGAE